MRDIAVQPPHMGREAIGLLARIVAGQDDGLAQDAIEPYLLVRLLRCGYVRRRTPGAGVVVATPVGIERSRIETIAERRRQDDLDRREIVRGRLRAMAARLDLDYPAAPPAMTLRDFGLPEIHQRRLPVLLEPLLPAVRLGGGLHAARDRRLAAVRDAGPRATPDDVLALIRESTRRAAGESKLPVSISGNLLQADSDLPVVHVGKIPPRREGRPQAGEDAAAARHVNGESAVREATVVAGCEASAPKGGTGSPGDHPPVRRAGDDSPQRDDVLPAWLLAALVDAPTGSHVPDADQPPRDAMPEALGGVGSGWKRASVMAAVAAVALLAADPLCQSLSRSADIPAPRPDLRAAVHSTQVMAMAEQLVSRAAAGSARPPAAVVVADRIVPAVTPIATPPVLVAANLLAPPPVPASAPEVTEHDAEASPSAIGVVSRADVHRAEPPAAVATPAPFPDTEKSDATGPAAIVAAVTTPASAVAGAPNTVIHEATETQPVPAVPATTAAQPVVAASASSQPVTPAVVADASRVKTPVPAVSMVPGTSVVDVTAEVPPTIDRQATSAPATDAASPHPEPAAPLLESAQLPVAPTIVAAPTLSAAAPSLESQPAAVAKQGVARQSEAPGGATSLPVGVATSDTTTATVQAASPDPVRGRYGAAWETVAIQRGAAATGDNQHQRHTPSVKSEAQVEPEANTASHVSARPHNGSLSDDAEVERLNTLSLRAAQAGRTFSPRLSTLSKAGIT